MSDEGLRHNEGQEKDECAEAFEAWFNETGSWISDPWDLAVAAWTEGWRIAESRATHNKGQGSDG